MIIPVGKSFMYIPHHVSHTTCENCREICEGGCNAGDYVIIGLCCLVLIITLFMLIVLIIDIYEENNF